MISPILAFIIFTISQYEIYICICLGLEHSDYKTKYNQLNMISTLKEQGGILDSVIIYHDFDFFFKIICIKFSNL